jgi:hypothetical protein
VTLACLGRELAAMVPAITLTNNEGHFRTATGGYFGRREGQAAHSDDVGRAFQLMSATHSD